MFSKFFKRKEVKEPEPVVRESAPCGNDETHYHWTEVEGWPCPACSGQAIRKKELKEDERRAKLLAKCIAEELNKINSKNEVKHVKY